MIKEKNYFLKGGMSQDFFCIFLFRESGWAPDKQAKMVLLKSSFSRRYSRKIRLHAVLACAKFCRKQFCLCRLFLALNEKT